MKEKKQNSGQSSLDNEKSVHAQQPVDQIPGQENPQHLNPQQLNQGEASFQSQDPKRRLGNFETAGEHSRSGTRGK